MSLILLNVSILGFGMLFLGIEETKIHAKRDGEYWELTRHKTFI